jgi:hypothetical protein
MTGPTSSKGEKKMGAGHKTLMDVAQGLHDLCMMLEDSGTDDPSIMKYCMKKCKKFKEEAGELKARAEKHMSKLNEDEKEDQDEDEDPMDEDDYEPTAEEKAIQVDDKGVIITKSFPEWEPRRMTFANLTPITPETPAPIPEPSPIHRKAMTKVGKRINKSVETLSQLLDAAIANGKL